MKNCWCLLISDMITRSTFKDFLKKKMQSGARTISILILSRLHCLSHSQNTPSTPVTTPATTSPSPPATNPPPSPSTLSSPPRSTVTRRSWPPAVARLIIRCIRSASTRSTSPRSCNARTIYRSIWRPRACNPRRRSSWRGEYLWPVNVNNTLRLTSKTPLQKLSFTWVSSQGKQLHFFKNDYPQKLFIWLIEDLSHAPKVFNMTPPLPLHLCLV